MIESVFIGDSITFAWPVPPDVAGRRRHRGIPGETSADMLARFEADVLRAAPLVLHILAGTNDVAGNGGPYVEDATVRAIATMAERAADAGIAVIIASVPPAAAVPWNRAADPVPAIRELNRRLRALAERLRQQWADYGAVLDDGAGGMMPTLADDGLHPNDAGYAMMEPVARIAIDAALASRIRRRPSR